MTAPIEFPGHEPGQPYELTREQFLRFLGQYEVYRHLLAIFNGDRAEQRAFWATIAAFEATRTFNPLDSCCLSSLGMNTDDAGDPYHMRWRYASTSWTVFEASEPRGFVIQSAPGYPGLECSDELQPGFFRVTIPADRDQPGRYHYESLREGGLYCE